MMVKVRLLTQSEHAELWFGGLISLMFTLQCFNDNFSFKRTFLNQAWKLNNGDGSDMVWGSEVKPEHKLNQFRLEDQFLWQLSNYHIIWTIKRSCISPKIQHEEEKKSCICFDFLLVRGWTQTKCSLVFRFIFQWVYQWYRSRIVVTTIVLPLVAVGGNTCWFIVSQYESVIKNMSNYIDFKV